MQYSQQQQTMHYMRMASKSLSCLSLMRCSQPLLIIHCLPMASRKVSYLLVLQTTHHSYRQEHGQHHLLSVQQQPIVVRSQHSPHQQMLYLMVIQDSMVGYLQTDHLVLIVMFLHQMELVFIGQVLLLIMSQTLDFPLQQTMHYLPMASKKVSYL